MSNWITFTIFGKPTAKGRPRFCKMGKFVKTYTPKKTREAENDFRSQSLPYRPQNPISGPLRVKIQVFRSIPKSFSKKKTELAKQGMVYPVSRPDIDNYQKLIFDAMNSIFWKDDSQIVECQIVKLYSDRPRIEIDLKEIVNA